MLFIVVAISTPSVRRFSRLLKELEFYSKLKKFISVSFEEFFLLSYSSIFSGVYIINEKIDKKSTGGPEPFSGRS